MPFFEPLNDIMKTYNTWGLSIYINYQLDPTLFNRYLHLSWILACGSSLENKKSPSIISWVSWIEWVPDAPSPEQLEGILCPLRNVSRSDRNEQSAIKFDDPWLGTSMTDTGRIPFKHWEKTPPFWSLTMKMYHPERSLYFVKFATALALN
jgi:hypothetical protein